PRVGPELVAFDPQGAKVDPLGVTEQPGAVVVLLAFEHCHTKLDVEGATLPTEPPTRWSLHRIPWSMVNESGKLAGDDSLVFTLRPNPLDTCSRSRSKPAPSIDSQRDEHPDAESRDAVDHVMHLAVHHTHGQQCRGNCQHGRESRGGAPGHQRGGNG